MKKVLILSVLGLVCLLWTNTKISQKNLDQLIALENIEALASGEGDSGGGCYPTIEFLPGAKTVFCGDCSIWEDYKGTGFLSKC